MWVVLEYLRFAGEEENLIAAHGPWLDQWSALNAAAIIEDKALFPRRTVVQQLSHPDNI